MMERDELKLSVANISNDKNKEWTRMIVNNNDIDNKDNAIRIIIHPPEEQVQVDSVCHVLCRTDFTDFSVSDNVLETVSDMFVDSRRMCPSLGPDTIGNTNI